MKLVCLRRGDRGASSRRQRPVPADRYIQQGACPETERQVWVRWFSRRQAGFALAGALDEGEGEGRWTDRRRRLGRPTPKQGFRGPGRRTTLSDRSRDRNAGAERVVQ